MASRKPLRILSLDGGGIRGISSLLILEDIMEKIREAEGLQHVPRPCERFDLIGGTSTGGIIAIMLGRLGMTVDECIRAYRKVAQQAFTPKSTSFIRRPRAGAFSAESLKSAIQQVIREFCMDTECVAHRHLDHLTECPHSDMAFRDGECTKTVVLAITKENVDAPPTLFTTYDTSLAFDSCTIWQVARATSAAVTFFKPVKIGRDEVEFIDAGFGYNNPCEILIEEGQRQFPDRTELQIFSIGTGLGDVVTIDGTWSSIIKALKKMATSSKHIATRLDTRYGDGHYYRFNVDRGLQDITLSDWEQASKISAHTHNYLAENERMIKKSARALTGTISIAEGVGEGQEGGLEERESYATISKRLDQAAISAPTLANGQEAVRIGGTSSDHSCLAFHFIPSLRNRRFVGREKILHMLKQMLFSQKESQCAAVFGLGGVGKTQVALQLAHWVKEHIPDRSIFWLPALSNGSFTQTCTEVARRLAISKDVEDENARELIRRYLSSGKAGPWFLIIDNADDSDVIFGSTDEPDGINDFLPESDFGVTLFTTRSRQVAVSVAGNDAIELQEMDSREANRFLEKSLIRKNLLSDEAAKQRLLDELNHLPLAISQAVAYLNIVGISIAEYLKLLHGTEREMVDLMSRQFHDNTRYKGSENAVATTWLVSFDQIRKVDSVAANILSFMSRIEPKAIPLSILPNVESEEQMVHAIGILDGYGFVSKREDTKMLDMHSLVHLATRIWIQKSGIDVQATEDTIRHIATKFPSRDYTNRTLWRNYLPHTLRVLQGKWGSDIKESYDLYMAAGLCLEADGRIKEAIRCVEICDQWRKCHLAEEDPSRLASQLALGRLYQADGQTKKAVELLEHVVMKQRMLPREDHSLLVSQRTLAISYEADGQIEKAIEVLEHVAVVEGDIFSREHPQRLTSLHALARVYQVSNQLQSAVEIFEHIAVVRSKTLPEEHPDRLASEHALARAYQAGSETKLATALIEHVTTVKKKIYPEEHPSQLEAQHTLALVYLAGGQIKKGVELLEGVVSIRKRTFREEHPDRLASEFLLAGAYQADGQTKKAIALLEHVTTIKNKISVVQDLFLLESQHILAQIYHADDQIKKAVNLLEHVVIICVKILNREHPHLLGLQCQLAKMYEANGRIKEATELYEHIAAMWKSGRVRSPNQLRQGFCDECSTFHLRDPKLNILLREEVATR